MDDEKTERRQSIMLEQHIGTILQITVVALLGWSLMTTQAMTSDMAVLKVKVESLTISIQQGSNDISRHRCRQGFCCRAPGDPIHRAPGFGDGG